MRDTVEIELRGKPVALVATTARLVEVDRQANAFHLQHAFAARIFETLETPWAQLQMSKFGYHRALRMAGCHDGDLVQLPGGIVEWRFPGEQSERAAMPAGFGRWCSAADGVRDLRWIVTGDPIARLTPDEVNRRAKGLAVDTKSILTS